MPQTEHIPVAYRGGAMRVAKALPAFDRVVVSAHKNPDGDALGSAVAAVLILRALGKEAVLYSASGIPDFLSFFSLPGPVYTDLTSLPFEPGGVFLVDLGELHRIGGDLEEAAKKLPCVNVDHHEGQGLGTLATWVEPQAAAACQLMAYLALCLDISLEGDLARAIALGLVTDTGGFSFASTTADVFDLSSYLLRNGLNLAALREEIDNTVRPERMRLWGKLTEKVVFLREGSVAFCGVEREMLASCGAKRDDLEGLAEYLRRIRGVKVSCIVREDEDTLCKFSLRSVPAVDVWSIAKTLGGGGHKNAAGGTVKTSFQETCSLLQKTLETSLF